MNKNTNPLNLNVDIGFDDDFDPLEDLGPDEDCEVSEYNQDNIDTANSASDSAEIIDDRPAKERIDALLTQMAPRRKVLLGIMDFCRDPKPVSKVNEFVDSLQEHNFSVYSAANLCALLEKAGALIRLTQDGETADGASAEPQVIEVDGVEYLEANTQAETNWASTPEALALVDADSPLDRFMTLLEEDARYASIYKRLLEMTAAEGGAATPHLGSAVDKLELMQSPRLYAPHFVDKLEKCDAIEWTKTWTITEIGRAGLATLVDVEDIDAATKTEEA